MPETKVPESRQLGEAFRNIRVCVDSYEESRMSGRFFHPGLGAGGCRFQSLASLLVHVEDLLDKTEYPQSFTARRTFQPLSPAVLCKAGDDLCQMGKKATFLVRILFRQHTSWQGSITWVEGRGKQNFRSVLELILLMDSALAVRPLQEQAEQRGEGNTP